jgi:hypothetical protein
MKPVHLAIFSESVANVFHLDNIPISSSIWTNKYLNDVSCYLMFFLFINWFFGVEKTTKLCVRQFIHSANLLSVRVEFDNADIWWRSDSLPLHLYQ